MNDREQPLELSAAHLDEGAALRLPVFAAAQGAAEDAGEGDDLRLVFYLAEERFIPGIQI